jgi:hypothetical protein
VIYAVAYNVLGGSLAALGAFHPWVAAVLMPASSLVVVGRTLLAFRRGVDSAASTTAPRDARRPLTLAPATAAFVGRIHS